MLAFVPVNASEVALVLLSAVLEPESLASARLGVPGAVGETLTEMVRVAVTVPSLTCTEKLSVPAYPEVGV